MLTADEETIGKIDNNRGNLSRSEFIERCIDEVKAGERRRAARYAVDVDSRPDVVPVYATREELQEFKRDIGGLLRSFMELYFAAGLELDAGKAVRSLEE